MSGWVRVDTRFPNHPKVLDVGPFGEALWLRGLCYAGDQLTDGFVPFTFVKRMGDMKGPTIAARLVDAGLWQECDGGYQIHEYLEWQRSRDEVDDISSKRAEAGRRGGKQRASNLLANSQANSQANAKQTGSKTQADTDTDTDTDKSRDELPPQSPTGDAKPKRSKAILSSLPDDFAVTDEMRQWARDRHKLTDADIEDRTEHFLNYVHKTGKQYAKWDAAWRDAMTWEPRNGQARAPTNGAIRALPSALDFAARAIELERQGL